MERVKNYLSEKENFNNYYEDLRKEIKVIINAPSDEIPEEALKNAIYLSRKCEVSIDKMDRLVGEMNKSEKSALEKTIIEVQSKKDGFEKRVLILLLLENVVKS